MGWKCRHSSTASGLVNNRTINNNKIRGKNFVVLNAFYCSSLWARKNHKPVASAGFVRKPRFLMHQKQIINGSKTWPSFPLWGFVGVMSSKVVGSSCCERKYVVGCLLHFMGVPVTQFWSTMRLVRKIH